MHAPLATRRRSLALVPRVDAAAAAVLEDAGAFAVAAAGDELLAVARATRDQPLLCLAPCRAPIDCQRARYFGADGVVLALDGYAALAESARSMRMMPLAEVADAAGAALAIERGARALFLVDAANAKAVAAAQPKVVLVVDASLADLDALAGAADAVVLPPLDQAVFAELAKKFEG